MSGAEHSPWLRILGAGREVTLRCGHLPVVVAPATRPPFPVAAQIVEEDTWLVLSASIAVREPREHPLRLLTELSGAHPLPPGSVVVREGEPMQLLAVIHDLDQVPSCRPEWLAQALNGVLREAAKRGLTSLALPLLGSIHGVLSPLQSAAILASVLPETEHGGLRRIWLVVPDGDREEVLEVLTGNASSEG
jgi:hypothetical protein